ncbi:MAG: adaptor protein [Bacillales bacterium]|jgi:adapter protein MecA 1/2|nr:adaptor protein [Bacillales bacterium]
MDIERIDEHTVKFFITIQDIENRGFSFEELWSDRQLGEKFMWELLEEVQEQEDIQFESGIKVQVNIAMNGLEFIVSNSFDHFGPISILQNAGEERKNPVKPITVKSLLENLIKQSADNNSEEASKDESVVLGAYFFENFEDVIGLFKNSTMNFEFSRLFYYKNRYYLSIDFEKEKFEHAKKVAIELILEEYTQKSVFSIHVLNEYGKIIISDHVYKMINKHF